MRKSVWLLAVFSFFVFAFSGSAFALTAGDTYTINFGVINSSGGVNAASYSTSATADSNGLVTFSLTGVPDNSSCNFMDVTAINKSTGKVELESIVPCPNPATTMPLGLSSVTNAQATALKAAFAAAQTDDPILAVFGLAVVQTSGIPVSDLTTIAKMAEKGIKYGFVNSLTTNHSNIVNATTLGEYRKNIVKDLADPNSGYSKLIKDSVDAISNSSAAEDRGKAAAVILGNLIQATHSPTDTGIHAGWIMEATDAMGSVVVPQLGNPALWTSPATPNEIQTSIGTGLNKLRTQVEIQKYEDAMNLLGGTAADLQQFQNAANALSNAVDAAMEQFNETAMSNGPMDSTTMDDAQQAMQTATMNDFNTFQSAVAASDTRIKSMIDNICTALGNGTESNAPTMFDPVTQTNTACPTSLWDQDQSWGLFKYFGPNGTQANWPINMVILSDWASKLKEAKGTMSYVRDTAPIPDSQQYDAGQWMGFCNGVTQTHVQCVAPPGNWMPSPCSKPLYNFDQTACTNNGGTWTANAGTCNYFNQNDCTTDSGGGIWVPERSCFGDSPLTGEQTQNCRMNPGPYWIMYAIQEDISIEQSIMQDKMQAAGQDMGQQGTYQQDFDNALDGIAHNISGTTDGSTAISKDQKKAVMELMQPPQM